MSTSVQHLLVLLSFITYSTLGTLGTVPANNPILVKPCNNYTIKRTNVSDSSLLNESEIAEKRNWDGIVPTHYHLNLHVSNLTHFNGTVKIAFNTTRDVTQLFINVGNRTPSVDYAKLSITDYSAIGDTKNCIQQAEYVESIETLILDLATSLGKGGRYAIHFDSFENGPGKLPLGLEQSSASVITFFQMRYARTVFPCFDQPSLKANFSFCIKHPVDLQAVSNTPLKTSSSSQDCFETTPKLSTYIFAFGLLKNFTTTNQFVQNNSLELVVYAKTEQVAKRSDTILALAKFALEEMEKLTKIAYPLPRLGFIVTDFPVGGMENMGLVSLAADTEDKHLMELVFHEVVHQWIGDLVTLSDWREICVQEGLTLYLTYRLIMKKREQSTRQKRQYDEFNMLFHDRDLKIYDPFFKPYNSRQDILKNCFDTSGLFFKSLEPLGENLIDRFVEILIKNHAYDVASIHDWDKALQKSGAKVENYFWNWFTKPGPVCLIQRKENGRTIFSQAVYDKNNPKSKKMDTSVARPIILTALISTRTNVTERTIIVEGKQEASMEMGENVVWFLFKRHTLLIRPIYSLDNYKNLFEAIVNSRLGINDTYSDGVLNVGNAIFAAVDFCRAFTTDLFPLQSNVSTQSSELDFEQWSHITKFLKEIMVRYNVSNYYVFGPPWNLDPLRYMWTQCGCCLNVAEDCKTYNHDKAKCSKLRIVNLTRDFENMLRQDEVILTRIGK